VLYLVRSGKDVKASRPVCHCLKAKILALALAQATPESWSWSQLELAADTKLLYQATRNWRTYTVQAPKLVAFYGEKLYLFLYRKFVICFGSQFWLQITEANATRARNLYSDHLTWGVGMA